MTPIAQFSTPPLPSASSEFLGQKLHVNNSSSTPNDTHDLRNEPLAVAEVAISATIVTLAVVGNSVVVMSLMMKRGKLSRMHLMMFHLSLADLSVAFFQVLPQMAWDITFRFQGGAFMCDAVKYLQLVTMYASSFVLLATAVDRYVAVCRPFLSHKWTSRHAHIMVLVAWLASLMFSLPQIFIFSLSEVEDGVVDCWANFYPPWTLKLYITWNALSVFIAPSFILAFLYGHISYAVWKSSKMMESLVPRYLPHATGALDARHPPTQPLVCDVRQRKSVWHGSCLRSSDNVKNSSLPADNREAFHTDASAFNPGSGHHNGTSDTAHYDRGLTSKKMPANPDRKESLGGPGQSRPLNEDVTSNAQLTDSPMHVNPDLMTDRPRSGAVGISRAKIKTIKLTFTVVICYLVCWTPFYVAQLWSSYDENVNYDNIFFTLVLLLASVNSCTNPWIYMAFSDTIWLSFRAKVLSLVCCSHYSVGRNEYTQAVGCDVHSVSSTYRTDYNRVSRL